MTEKQPDSANVLQTAWNDTVLVICSTCEGDPVASDGSICSTCDGACVYRIPRSELRACGRLSEWQSNCTGKHGSQNPCFRIALSTQRPDDLPPTESSAT
jgi:hypothetical protein